MSGETEKEVSGWTTDTLRDFILRLINEHDKRYEQRFLAQESAVQAALVAQEKAVNAALIAADRAVAKAETAQERRNEATNEFRGQLSDQAARLMPRAETEQLFHAMNEKIGALTTRVDRQEGRSGGYGASGALALSILSLVATVAIGILVVVTRH